MCRFSAIDPELTRALCGNPASEPGETDIDAGTDPGVPRALTAIESPMGKVRWMDRRAEKTLEYSE